MTNNLKFSLFGELNGLTGSKQINQTEILTFDELINYYKSTENKQLSKLILNETDKQKQKQLKSKRIYYTPYGVFKKRNNDSITHHNNIVSIDIDNLESKQKAIEVKEQINKHNSILFSCLSVRGEGVKALMLVNQTYTPQQQYKQLKNCFKPYLSEYLCLDVNCIDSAQFVLSQACYFSYDENFYINKNAIPLELVFDYTEPLRPEFKPIDVPDNSRSRIDKYLKSILQNKINKLTSSGARHPQLFTIKELGQLIHYAPHLENDIINNFIDGGVQMYGSETMRNNVTDSVMRAFEEGKIESVNNFTIDKIIKEVNR